MMMRFLIAFVLVLSHAAEAADVVFCAKYKVDYSDALSDLHDDYFTDNNDKNARGALVRWIRNYDGDTHEEYATHGANGNCTDTITLIGGLSYTVRIYSEAYVDSINTIKVVNNATGVRWYSNALTSYVPPAAGETKTITTAGFHEAWNVAAAAGWATHVHNGGVTGETFLFRTGGDRELLRSRWQRRPVHFDSVGRLQIHRRPRDGALDDVRREWPYIRHNRG